MFLSFTSQKLDGPSDVPSRKTSGDISSAPLSHRHIPLLLLLRHSISKGMMITLRGVIKKFVVPRGRSIPYLKLERQGTTGTFQ
ncbi:hypothetical protein ANN_11424 [Periplaneta americana]|uniref:Uncharacterized protein n=1 Tax=Periplaneta americana TaxID=6978 RepID=A0ABQ8T4Y8_PERAM|nr:hypothetical protein ANN_11424 [Periplaneta americana]